MAELIQSDVNALQDGVIGGLPNGNLTGGELRIATVKVVMTGSLAAGDTVGLVDLPVGSVFEPALSSVSCDDHGTTLKFSIVDGDANVYVTTVDLSTAQSGLISDIVSASIVDATALAATPLTSTGNGLFLSASAATSVTDGSDSTWKIAYRI